MRRLYACVMALGLVGSMLGCHNGVMRGVCDCDPREYGCPGYYPCCGHDYVGGSNLEQGNQPPLAKPEVIKEMPKDSGK